MLSLPIDGQILQITTTLNQSSALVLSAAPGAGKTTRLPPALLSCTHKKVWVLEPRRVAAVAAAHRIAEEQSWQLGKEVGYQVRFENKCQEKTRLVFLTEALLARKILQSPQLDDVGIVVLDEFHERSIHVDTALGLLKELQLLSRPDLKIVVMSATLNTRGISEFLDDCPIVDVPGKIYDLQLQKINESQLLRTDSRFIERVTEKIRSHVLSFPQKKDVLVFLPGQSEISRVQEKIYDFAQEQNLLVTPLTGSLNIKEQWLAIKPQPRRKVILATNVAESSLTIDGVDTVIDSGLARVLKRHPKTEFEQLITARISKASAKQRAGRAARQYPGICYQLWNSFDETSMPEFDVAEIHRIDLTETLLFLKSWGISDVQSFSWFEPPQDTSIISAENMLKKIGAIDKNGITVHGKRLSQLPLHPRVAQVLLVSEKFGFTNIGADLCALIAERDFAVGANDHCDNDFLERLEVLWDYRKSSDRQPGYLRKNLESIDQAARQISHFAVEKTQETLSSLAQNKKNIESIVAEILLLSFPDRLCRRRAADRSQALMVGGRGVNLAETSLVKKAEFFIAIDLMESANSADTQVRRACPVTKELIEQHFSKELQKRESLRFNDENGQFYIEQTTALWDLPIDQPRKRPLSSNEVQEYLPQIFIERWDQLLKENSALSDWFERWNYFETKIQASNFWTPENKLLALQQACLGESRWENVAGKGLIFFFENLIASNTLVDFHKKCPDKFIVPTGNKIKIHYHSDKDPHLEVRLQELFGLRQSPAIWNETIPITLHLLGPNYRPVQMTSDLISFWKNTYSEVRKELRSRYPKHSWPEDPMTALPVAKGRSKK